MSTRIDSREAVKNFKKVYLTSRWSQIPHGRGFQPPQLYRCRSRVERKQAELVRHGLRRLRYLGQEKRQLQRLWTGAVVNLKRLFTLGQKAEQDLRALFAPRVPPMTVLAVR